MFRSPQRVCARPYTYTVPPPGPETGLWNTGSGRAVARQARQARQARHGRAKQGLQRAVDTRAKLLFDSDSKFLFLCLALALFFRLWIRHCLPLQPFFFLFCCCCDDRRPGDDFGARPQRKATTCNSAIEGSLFCQRFSNTT